VLLVIGVGGVVTLFIGRFSESYTADRTVSDVSGSVGDVEGMSMLGRGIGWWGDGQVYLRNIRGQYEGRELRWRFFAVEWCMPCLAYVCAVRHMSWVWALRRTRRSIPLCTCLGPCSAARRETQVVRSSVGVWLQVWRCGPPHRYQKYWYDRAPSIASPGL
jgi:hypothetical protein